MEVVLAEHALVVDDEVHAGAASREHVVLQGGGTVVRVPGNKLIRIVGCNLRHAHCVARLMVDHCDPCTKFYKNDKGFRVLLQSF